MENKPLEESTKRMVDALSRRTMLQAGAIGGSAAFLAACGIRATPKVTQSKAPDYSDKEKVMNWSTWIDYIDIDDAGNRPTLDLFAEATGVTVNYNEDYNDNNEFLAKVKTQLEAGQSIDRDLVTPTDWMCAYWISRGFVQEIDRANCPNTFNILPAWQRPAFDVGRMRSVPWQSGFGGLGWSRKLLKELTGKTELRTVDELWDPRLRGRITILSEMRDSMGVMLMALGKRADNFTDQDFQDAIDAFQEQVDNGQIRQVSGNDYKAAMAAGEVAAAIAWSGDMLNDTETYGFNIPESGGTLWTDNLVIPVGARHKKNAEKWLDFYYDPSNAARVAAYVNYISPVAGAQEAMKKIDPTMVDNPAIFPTAETLAQTQIFMTLNAKQQAAFEGKFQALAGA